MNEVGASKTRSSPPTEIILDPPMQWAPQLILKQEAARNVELLHQFEENNVDSLSTIICSLHSIGS